MEAIEIHAGYLYEYLRAHFIYAKEAAKSPLSNKEAESYRQLRMRQDGINTIIERMQQYANEEKRTEAIEFGYGCAFMIDECPTIEDVEKVYNKWNEKTKEET